MSFSVLLIFTFLVGVFTYYFWHYTYWIRRGIPGPRGFPVVGVSDKTFSQDFPPLLQIREWSKKYGPVFGFTEGLRKTLVISDVETVNEVFVKQFDNFYGRKLLAVHGDPEKDKRVNLFVSQGFRWKRLRTISSPTFSNNSLRKLMGTVEDCSLELLKHIETGTKNGEQIDMLVFYQEFTLEVIGRIAMGQTDSQMFRNPMLPFVRSIFGEGRKKLFMIGAIAPKVIHLMRWLNQAKDPSAYIRNVVETAVRKRVEDRKAGIRFAGEPEDFIDMFLDAEAEKEDAVDNYNSQAFSQKDHSKVSKKLTFDEIIAQCIVFIIAGFDTTALSLSFSTFLLATNTEAQRKLQEEIDRECPDPEITFDQLAKLKYLEAVIKETLRLYPLAAPANSRTCMKDTVIGKDGIRIEKGTVVAVNTWKLQRDPKIWGDDAEEFRPERWLDASNSTELLTKGAFIPFGYGPRQCIGMRLAYMEEKMLLAHILRKYSFEIGAKTQIPMKLRGRATTQPESVWMLLKLRD